MKTRRIEMGACFPDRTWTDSLFIDIPLDTPEGDIDRVAIDGLTSILNRNNIDAVHVFVYNIPEIEE